MRRGYKVRACPRCECLARCLGRREQELETLRSFCNELLRKKSSLLPSLPRLPSARQSACLRNSRQRPKQGDFPVYFLADNNPDVLKHKPQLPRRNHLEEAHGAC